MDGFFSSLVGEMWFVPVSGETVGVVRHVLSVDWVAQYEVGHHDGKLELRGLVVRPRTSTPGPLGEVVARLAPARALEAARSRESWAAGADGAPVKVQSSEEDPFGMVLPTRRGRPPRPLHERLRLAVIYVEEYEAHGQKGLIGRVADRAGYSEANIRKAIHELRGDLLTRTTRGRAGGELTERAMLLRAGQAPPFMDELVVEPELADESAPNHRTYKDDFWEAGARGLEVARQGMHESLGDSGSSISG